MALITSQGFQCASPEMSVARKAYAAKDWSKARTSLEKALAADPNNCEAHLLMGQVQQQMNDIPAMVKSLRAARDCQGAKPALRADAQTMLYQAWAGEYNSGVQSYNAWVETKQTAELEKASRHLEATLEIQPEISDPMALLGVVYESRHDTTSAVKIYERWYAIEQPGADIVIQRGLFLGMTRGDVLKRLGTPVQSHEDSVENGAITTDKFDVGGRDLFTFTIKEGNAVDGKLEGWSYNPSADLPERIRSRSRVLRVGPIKALAFIAYQRGKTDEAMTWVKRTLAWSPSDAEISPLRLQLLQATGKIDEAMQELKSILARDPKNVAARLSLADMHNTAGHTQEAIEGYQSVLSVEPNNDIALYSLGALYKNMAGAKQGAERRKRDADPKHKENLEYLDDLQKSATYYQQLRKTFKYQDDLIVIEQLGNIYEVRGETAKVQAIIMELEGLEHKYQTDKKYYRVLEGFYGRNKMPDKMKEVQQKGAKL